MGFLDAASDIASKASSALDAVTGGQKTGTSAGEAKFVKGDILTDKDAKQGGSAAPAPDGAGKPVTFDFGIPTEFVHFGRFHPDTGKAFPHDNFDPESGQPAPEGHGIMFRDALEREAILLFGYISSCKTAVQDTTKQRGAVEAIGAMASNLLGGGNATAKPDPTQLDSFTGKIKTEAGKINKAQILYPEIHECGKQFQTIRADYAAFCDSLDAFYLKPPKSEGIGAISDTIGSAAANIPGVGKIFGVVQRIAFKFLDLYLAAFLELRKNHEKTVEIAVHKLTIDAIKGKYAKHLPIYPVWFKKPEKKDEVATDKKTGSSGASVSTDDIIKKVTESEKFKTAKEKAESVRDKIYDFAGVNGAPASTPGSAALKAAFAALKGGGDTTPDAVPGAADCIIKGLDATLSDIGGVPNFMKTVVREIMDGNISLLEEVFARLMAADAKPEIDSSDLLKAGRRYLTTRISKAFTKLVFGMITGGEDFTVGVPMGGKTLSAQEMIGKQMDERLGKYVEPVLQICIGDLAGQLKASQKKAKDQNANTMEVFLGRLPWLTAMMFRNTFFPIWNLVAEEVMGEISPPLKSALKAINAPFDKAKDVIDKGQEYKRRAEEAKKQAEEVKDKASNVHAEKLQDLKDHAEGIKKEAGDVKKATETETEEGKARQAERDAAQAEKDNLDKFYQDNDKDKDFPVTGRIAAGEALKVEEEVPSVLPETA